MSSEKMGNSDRIGMKNWFVKCGILSLALACAEDRPLETVNDLDGNRFSKSSVLINDPWIMRAVVVDASPNSTIAFVGQQSLVKTGYFRFTPEHLEFKTQVGPQENSAHLPSLVNQWPVVHSHYTMQEIGGRKTNIEIEDPDLTWQEKSHFKIDWDSQRISDSSEFLGISQGDCWQKRESHLIEGSAKVSSESITYKISRDYEIDSRCLTGPRYLDANLTQTIVYQYSFHPLKETSYKPYLYTGENDPLMKKYGYFNTVTWSYDDLGQKSNKFLMNRWDPEKTHVYYFASDYPEEYKWIFNDPEKGIFPLVNKLFSENLLPIRFVVRDYQEGKEFGDSRYSFIKIITNKELGGPLGYGPSTVNPKTGEIISANIVMGVQDLAYYLSLGKTQEEARTNDSTIMRKMELYLGTDRAAWTATADGLARNTSAGRLFDLFLPDYTYHAPGNLFASRALGVKSEGSPYFYRPESDFLQLLENQATGSAEQLKNHFKIFQREFSDLSNWQTAPGLFHDTVYPTEEALQGARLLSFQGMSDAEIISKILYRTAVHEFGHQLALRHNFYGSVDIKNFSDAVVTADDSTVEQSTSSVMDYHQFVHSVHYNPGFESYDKAAIVYAYSSGKVDFSTDKKTDFLFCSDQHVSLNPLCNRFDTGTTPSQIARSLIEDYDQKYKIRNFRNNRSYWYPRNYGQSIFALMASLKSFIKFEQETYDETDLDVKISSSREVSHAVAANVSNAVKTDVRQAILISAAFYSAVMQQSVDERSYLDLYDSFSGSLEAKGILEDKVYAARFLLGDDGFALSPNRGVLPTSFLSYLALSGIGPTLTSIIDERMADPGPIHPGFDTIFRTFYSRNAAYWRDNGGTASSLSRLRVACFSPTSFAEKFNIADIYAFSENGEAAREIVKEKIALSRLDANADDYFRSGSTEAAVIKLNGRFYVASKELNPLSYDLIDKANASEVLRFYLNYHLLTEGRVPDCD